MFAVLALAALAQEPLGPPPSPPPSLTARVNRAIAFGVEHLKREQQASGAWNGAEGEHPGGMTALCAFTLLKSGVRRRDDSVQRALTQVLATSFKSTYSHSVRLLFFDALAQPESWRERAAQSLEFLVAGQTSGQWAYPWGAADASNTQFALLGLRAARRLGLEVPAATLTDAAKALFRLQSKTGGFGYEPSRQPTGGITAATLAGVCVLREFAPGNRELEALLRKHEREIDSGAAWLAAKFEPERNAYGPRAWTPTFHYPYLWAVERYGGLAGETRLGERDWYAEGAAWLVEEQLENGAWGKLEDTCFALLFLRRATVTSGEATGAGELALERPSKRPAPAPAADALRLVDWLVAGPWRGAGADSALLAPPFDPRKVEAREGKELARRAWTRVTLKPAGWTDLDELTASQGDGGLYAAATTLVWPLDEPLEAALWFDFEDGADVYLDGVRVAFTERVQGPIDASLRVEVTLTRGEHRLLCLIEDERGAAACGARLAQRGGSKLERAPEVRAVPPKGSKR